MRIVLQRYSQHGGPFPNSPTEQTEYSRRRFGFFVEPRVSVLAGQGRSIAACRLAH